MNQKHADYFESNLKLLKKHHIKIWEQMTENPPEPMGNIVPTSNEKPNLIVKSEQGKSITLHPEMNPEKESEDFLKKIPLDHKGFVAILGLGLGYAALRILKERPHLQRLALFDLEPGIFIQALLHIDLSPILADPRLILGIDAEPEISKILSTASKTLQLEDSKTLHHLRSFELNPKGYNQLKDNIYSHLNSQNVGGATTRVLGKDFMNNRFKHISTIHHHMLLEHIQNKFEGLPAILVAGGPSLDKNIHLLKQVQENAVIIAVDTVLPALLKNGVHPHFLTCIDPNNLTFEKFADVIPFVKDTALICSSWVNPKTPKVFPADQVFWTFTAKPMEAWLNSLFGGKVLTGGASTVAHLNLIAAHVLKCDPVIFIGQDLAYPGKTSHAEGTVLQGIAPTNTITNNTLGETVIGINGEVLRTNRSFLSMKEFFESAISKSDKTHINATEGGANIEGTQILTLQETIEKYCKSQIEVTPKLKAFYSDAPGINPTEMLAEFKKISNKVKSIQKTIQKADNITKQLSRETSKLKKNKRRVRSFDMLSLKQRKQINNIDKFHKNLDNTPKIWKLLEEITMEGLKESERQKQDISILANSPDKYLEWLTKNLNRLLDINQIRIDSLDLLADNLKSVISFHETEAEYSALVQKGSKTREHQIALSKFYIDSKNYFLAKPILAELRNEIPESGEVNFYLGCVSSQSNMHDEANQYFEDTVIFNSEFAEKIDSYTKELGDIFLGFAQYFKTQPGREISVKYMVIKGLKHDPDHNELIKELKTILKKELQQIKSDIDKGLFEDAAGLLDTWYPYVMEQEDLFQSLPEELSGDLFLCKGKLLLSRADHPNALTCFKKAMTYLPEDHDIHSNIIDVLFATGDFNGAIEALNNAIKVDTKFAAYWETIGDSLQSANQNEDAVIAYERCFTHLPGNINLLKKIGDCYMAMDQLEAAKTAYQQLKQKMEALNESDNGPIDSLEPPQKT